MKMEMVEKPNRGKILFQIGDLQLNLMNMKTGFHFALLQKGINDEVQIGEARQLPTGAAVKRKGEFVNFKIISSVSLFNSEETRHHRFSSKKHSLF